MGDRIRSVGLLVIGGTLAVVIGAAGVIRFDWPWNIDDVATIDRTIVVEEPARIFEIHPISLDCRARVHAEVPVRGQREHRVLGQVYRTDTVELTAVGDVDTCVDASQVEITDGADGRFQVSVPASSIEFVRPRVDMSRTARSVHVDQGLVGKLTDVFPWVSDDNNLTSSAYAYAQSVIGGSDCMQTAYRTTARMIEEAYRTELAAQGGDPSGISVKIEGVPDFSTGEQIALEGIDMAVAADGATCTVAEGAIGVSPVSPS